MTRRGVLAALSLAALGCDEAPPPGGGAAAALRAVPSEAAERSDPPPAPTRLRFADATEASGLAAFRQVNGSAEKPYLVESVGGGVAVLDADGDGRLDVYLTNGGVLGDVPADERPADALFRNAGGGRFVDVTAEAGLGDRLWTMGAYAADLDGDARPEILLTSWGPDVLYLNEGGRFRDVTAEAGLDLPGWSTGAAFLDHDRDGDLDLYVAAYVVLDPEALPAERHEYRGVEVNFGPRGLPGAADRFLVNGGPRGGGGDGGAGGAAPRFADATEALGLAGANGYGLGVAALDLDEDGWTDVFVANDSTPNYLWCNVEGERFEERGLAVGLALSKHGIEQAGMGIAVGDPGGDGLLDLYVTNFSEDYSTLYEAEPGGTYADATARWRVAWPTQASLGWGCALLDLDADGDDDLFAANGHVYPQVDRFDFGTRYRQRNQLFENVGRAFREVTDLAGPGLAVEAASRGTAWGDLDGDGDLDLVVGNLDGPPTLLRNDSERAGRLVHLRVRGAAPNTGALGARVTVAAGGRECVLPVGEGSGFLSTSDPTRVLALPADATRLDAVLVRWPTGAVQRFEEVALPPPGDGTAEVLLVEGEDRPRVGLR